MHTGFTFWSWLQKAAYRQSASLKTTDSLLNPKPSGHNNIAFSPKCEGFTEYFKDMITTLSEHTAEKVAGTELVYKVDHIPSCCFVNLTFFTTIYNCHM